MITRNLSRRFSAQVPTAISEPAVTMQVKTVAARQPRRGFLSRPSPPPSRLPGPTHDYIERNVDEQASDNGS